MKLEDIVELKSGSPQFRIKESGTITYKFYGQQELENDLVDMEVSPENPRGITTMDDISLLEAGDVLFSLVSGRASIVREKHQGYLYTQNYVKLIPTQIEARYLVYLLNESTAIRQQWQRELQGTSVLKYTVRQLRDLELPPMHEYEKQKIVGDIYFDEERLKALRIRVAETERILTMYKLKGANI